MREYQIRSFRPGQATLWFAGGWRLLRRRPIEVLVPAAVFSLALMLLMAIPVLGNILPLLVLPGVLASHLLQAHMIALTGNTTSNRPGKPPLDLKRRGRDLQQSLAGAWSKPDNVLPLFVVSLALALAGAVVHVLFTTVGGQAVADSRGLATLSILRLIQLLSAYGLATLLWMLVAALLLWTLPLLALRDQALAGALTLNLRALRQNTGAVFVLLLALPAGLLPVVLLKSFSPTASALMHWLLLTLLMPYIGCCIYCSYRLVIMEPATARN